ncbi:MAG: hypothetical protein O7C01_04535 [Actinobacteria bacterium]|nr:hypothetical protein [Actinomycetota bacterium]
MRYDLGLVADSVEEPRYDASDIPEHLHKGDRAFAAVPAGMLNRYLDIRLVVHHHFALRWVTGDREEYCAVVEYASPELGFASAERRDASYAHLASSEVDQAPDVNESMLVLVPEVVKSEQRLSKRVGPLRIRLNGFDECRGTGADTMDRESSTASFGVLESLRAAPLVAVGIDREGRLRNIPSGEVNGEPVDALVEGRAEIVDGFAQDHSPIDRYGFMQPDPVDVLRSIRVYLRDEFIGLTFLPSELFILDGLEVLVRSFNLPPDAFYRSGINLHPSLP